MGSDDDDDKVSNSTTGLGSINSSTNNTQHAVHNPDLVQPIGACGILKPCYKK